MGADDGGFGGTVGPVNGDVFAEGVVIADAKFGGLRLKAEVLGKVSEHHPGMNAVAATDGGVAGDVNMRADDAFGTDLDMFINDGAGADPGIGADPGVRMNDSSGVDHQV